MDFTVVDLVQIALAVIVPQLVGFAATRLVRRPNWSTWAIASAMASGPTTWAVLWVAGLRAPEGSQLRCGTGAIIALFMGVAMHYGLGIVLGLLDDYARRFSRSGDRT